MYTTRELNDMAKALVHPEASVTIEPGCWHRFSAPGYQTLDFAGAGACGSHIRCLAAKAA